VAVLKDKECNCAIYATGKLASSCLRLSKERKERAALYERSIMSGIQTGFKFHTDQEEGLSPKVGEEKNGEVEDLRERRRCIRSALLIGGEQWRTMVVRKCDRCPDDPMQVASKMTLVAQQQASKWYGKVIRADRRCRPAWIL
jgi:hypothetical protein